MNPFTNPTTADQWKKDLELRMARLKRSFACFEKGSKELNLLSGKAIVKTSLSAVDAVQAVYNHWLQEVVNQAVLHYGSEHCVVTISAYDLESNYMRLGGSEAESLWVSERSIPMCQAPINDVIDFALRLVVFSAIHSDLAEKGDSLIRDNIDNAAITIGRELGLVSRGFNREAGQLVVKKVKGLYPLRIANNDSSAYRRLKSLDDFKRLSKILGAETGHPGLTYIMQACVDEEEQRGKQANPARSTHVVHCAGSVAFQKNEIVLHLFPDLFEAIVGFVRTHVDPLTVKDIVTG